MISIAYLYNNAILECITALGSCLFLGVSCVCCVRLHKHCYAAFPRAATEEESDDPSAGRGLGVRCLMWFVWMVVTLLFTLVPALYVLAQSIPPAENTIGLPLGFELFGVIEGSELLQGAIGLVLGVLMTNVMPFLATRLHRCIISSNQENSSAIVQMSVFAGEYQRISCMLTLIVHNS